MLNSVQITYKQCGNCRHVDEWDAKFCASCGSRNWQPYNSRIDGGQTTDFLYPDHPSNGTPTLVLPDNIPKSVPLGMARALTNLNDTYVPAFAHVRANTAEAVHLAQVELAKLMLILARERFFLLMHFSIWACVNIVGFTLAIKCYNEFIGDEMTKIMIGCTPFWLFNIIGLNCIHMIAKTKKAITRLKEQIAHARFKVEYGHLF
jgi:hypothetical protein